LNNLLPPVHVERVIVDGKHYDASANEGGIVKLPALIGELEIDYTALSLVASDKVLFRYWLEGHDNGWQDVGTRRQAFYNDLQPGSYRFRVMACNNNGVWNEAGTFLELTIAPAYYQTIWFQASMVLAFLLALGALYQLRLQQVSRQMKARMEERLEERERIARDLHDTLLQGVQGLILKFHAGVKQLRPEDPTRLNMENALEQADQILAEGRERVRNLRAGAESLKDLSAAFKRIAEENSDDHRATFVAVVEGNARELHPLVLEESYCIGRAALLTALAHSEGSHVEVELAFDSRQFRLRVRDDGRGIDPEIIELGGRPGHWGLQGMRERAQKIGAQLKLWSGPETGTEIELTVPGATAYRTDGDRSKWSWFSRIFGR